MYVLLEKVYSVCSMNMYLNKQAEHKCSDNGGSTVLRSYTIPADQLTERSLVAA